MSDEYDVSTDEGGMNKGFIVVIAIAVIALCTLGIWLIFFKGDKEESNTSSSGATTSPTSNTSRSVATATSNTSSSGATASPTSTSTASEETLLNNQYNLWCQQNRGFKSDLHGTQYSWVEKLSSPYGLPEVIRDTPPGSGGRGLVAYTNDRRLSKKEFKVECFKKCNVYPNNVCGAVKLTGELNNGGKPRSCILYEKIKTKNAFDNHFNIAIEKDNKHTAEKRTSDPTSDNLYHGAEEFYVKKEFLPTELRKDNITNKEIVKDASFCPFKYISYNGWGGLNNYHSLGIHPASTVPGPNRMSGSTNMGCQWVDNNPGRYKNDNSIIRRCSEICDSRNGCSGFWVWGKRNGEQYRTRDMSRNEGKCCLKGPLVPGKYEKIYYPGHNGSIPTNREQRRNLNSLVPGGYFIKKERNGAQGAFPSKSHNCLNCLPKDV